MVVCDRGSARPLLASARMHAAAVLMTPPGVRLLEIQWWWVHPRGGDDTYLVRNGVFTSEGTSLK